MITRMTRRLHTAFGFCLISLVVSCPSASSTLDADDDVVTDQGGRRDLRETGRPDAILDESTDMADDTVAGDPVVDTDVEPPDLADDAPSDTLTDDTDLDAVAEIPDQGEGEIDATDEEVSDAAIDPVIDAPMNTEGCTILPSTGDLVLGGEVTSESPHWNLPNTADCSVDVGGESGAFYELFELCNTGPNRQFDFTAEGGRDDPTLTLGAVAIFLYRGAGLPDAPMTCAAQAHNVGADGLIDDFEIPASTRVTLIASSFSDVITGTFRLTASAQ